MTAIDIPPPQRYDRVSAWIVRGRDAESPHWARAEWDDVWHWTPDWRTRAPFACGRIGGGQPEFGPDDARDICPVCLAASMPR